jgi:hypothetical protein
VLEGEPAMGAPPFQGAHARAMDRTWAALRGRGHAGGRV